MSSAAGPDKDNWSASVYQTNASFVYSQAFTSPVLALLSPRPGERVLDLGCGAGEPTLQIARAVQADGKQGSVVGVDMSRDLLRQAREQQEQAGVTGVEWVERDGHDLSGVEGGFDAAFSNAALHWMKRDPKQVRVDLGAGWCEAALTLLLLQVARNVYDLLRPGARYAAELGGQ